MLELSFSAFPLDARASTEEMGSGGWIRNGYFWLCQDKPGAVGVPTLGLHILSPSLVPAPTY